MSDLGDLYQEVILDHNKSPRNFGPLPDANHHADGYNPLCGDRVTVFVRVEDGVIQDCHFDGSGCAISTASASGPTTRWTYKEYREKSERSSDTGDRQGQQRTTPAQT